MLEIARDQKRILNAQGYFVKYAIVLVRHPLPPISNIIINEMRKWIVQYMCAKDEMGPDELFIREIEYD